MSSAELLIPFKQIGFTSSNSTPLDELISNVAASIHSHSKGVEKYTGKIFCPQRGSGSVLNVGGIGGGTVEFHSSEKPQ
jgi:hypothetical protein